MFQLSFIGEAGIIIMRTKRKYADRFVGKTPREYGGTRG